MGKMEIMLNIAVLLAGGGCAFAGVALFIAIIWAIHDNR